MYYIGHVVQTMKNEEEKSPLLQIYYYTSVACPAKNQLAASVRTRVPVPGTCAPYFRSSTGTTYILYLFIKSFIKCKYFHSGRAFHRSWPIIYWKTVYDKFFVRIPKPRETLPVAVNRDINPIANNNNNNNSTIIMCLGFNFIAVNHDA